MKMIFIEKESKYFTYGKSYEVIEDKYPIPKCASTLDDYGNGCIVMLSKFVTLNDWRDIQIKKLCK